MEENGTQSVTSSDDIVSFEFFHRYPGYQLLCSTSTIRTFKKSTSGGPKRATTTAVSLLSCSTELRPLALSKVP